MNSEPNSGQRDVPPASVTALRLADLSFLTCLERSELGETWKVHTPTGKGHLCQFLPPTDAETADTLLARLQSFRHRNLAPWMAVRDGGNRLALLTPLEGPTLWDRFQELWATKQPGIPREEMLAYLRSAATTLDLLQSRHQAQHLWIHPRQLVIQEDRVQILGFGLVETWWARTDRPTSALNMRYSAPELLRKTRSAQCDQFSLALLYAEMLTGRHPWRGRTPAAGLSHDLTLLPARDREVIRRALHEDGRQRFENCSAMVEALEEAATIFVPPPAPEPLLVPAQPDGTACPCATLEQFVEQLVSLVAGNVPAAEELKVRFILERGRTLRTSTFLSEKPDALPRFDDFCRQWHAKTTRREDGLVILAINAAPSMWQWLRRPIGLEIRFQFLPVAWGNRRAEVVVTIKPYGCDHQKAAKLVQELGSPLLRSVRQLLQAQSEQRGLERLPIRQRLRVSPIVNGAMAEPIECISKDVSAGGIGFYLPKALPATEVYVSMPEIEKIAAYSALAQVVRKQPAKEGWFEIGAAFPTALGKKKNR